MDCEGKCKSLSQKEMEERSLGMLTAAVASKTDNGALHELRVPTNLFFRPSLYRLHHQSL